MSVKKTDKIPFDLRALLKVKIKSLAEEARIIRIEEQRTNSTRLYRMLNQHRRKDVREEARWAQLAYGFLRGRALHEIERTEKPVNWDRVRKLVSRYGPLNVHDKQEALKAFEVWKSPEEVPLKKAA